MSGQLALATNCCKIRDCPFPTVGSSITGEGHVCKGHNEAEWSRALRKQMPYYAVPLGRDSARSLALAAADQGEGER